MTALPGWARAPRAPRLSLPGLRLLNVVLLLALGALGAAAYLATGTKTTSTRGAVRTAPVARGVVLSSVSATGTLQPASDVGLDFETSGRLTQVAVRAGERVKAGQLLGRLDASTARAGVLNAQASLASAKANLQQTLAGETTQQRAVDALSVTQANAQVATAKTSLASARTQLRQDERTTAATVAQAGSSPALKQARQQLHTDQGNERGQVAKLTADRAQLVFGGKTYTSADEAVAAATNALHTAEAKQQADQQSNAALQTQQTADSQKLTNDKASLAAAQASGNQTYVATWTGTVAVDQNTVDSDALALSQLQQTLQNDGFAVTNAQTAVTTLTQVQTQVNADQSAITQLEAKIVSDRNAVENAKSSLATAVTNAETSRAATLTKDRQAIQTAQQQVASAQLGVTNAQANVAVKQAPPTAATLAQLRAAVLQAQSSLETAQKTLAETVLRAPEAGTIAAVNGTVGGEVSGSGTSSTSAASAATSSSSSSSGGSGSGSGGSGSSGSSSSAFVTLVGSLMQVSAAFSESDAAKIAVGQPATVTVSALPGEELAAHVISVGVMGTSSSGVVEYPVVFALDRTAPSLRPGMSANVSVTVAERDNVLNVPSAAVTGSGSNARVTVVSNGVRRTVPVVAGLQGDSATEIVSGLTAGQQVVTSTGTTLFSSGSATTGTSTTSTSTPRRFGGGLGGGGFAFPGG